MNPIIPIALTSVLESLALVVLSVQLIRLRRRYERFRAQTGEVLYQHQDHLAKHAAVINHLGGRTEPIPTPEELQAGRWMR